MSDQQPINWMPPPSGGSRSRSNAGGASWTGASCSACCCSRRVPGCRARARAARGARAGALAAAGARVRGRATRSRSGSSSPPAPATPCRRSSCSCRCCCCCRRRWSRCSSPRRLVAPAAWSTSLRGAQRPGRACCGLATPGSRSAPPLVLVRFDAQLPDWAHLPAYVARARRAARGRRAVLAARARLVARRAAARTMLAEIGSASASTCCSPRSACSRRSRRPTPRRARCSCWRWSRCCVGFEREREGRIQRSLELGRAYRGTALLLRDLLEDDDEYTGHHTEDVVELRCRSPSRWASTRTRCARPRWARCCTTSARSPCPTRSSTSPAR